MNHVRLHAEGKQHDARLGDETVGIFDFVIAFFVHVMTRYRSRQDG